MKGKEAKPILNEKRRSDRFFHSQTAWVREEGQTFQRVHLFDLSDGGASVSPSFLVGAGPIDLIVRIDQDYLTLSGRCVWRDENRCGLCFTTRPAHRVRERLGLTPCWV